MKGEKVVKNTKVKVAVAAIICIMIFVLAPAFLVGALKTRSMTMRVGDNAQIELTNPMMQMIAKYDVVDGNMITTEPGGMVEAYGPGETEVEIKVPFRTMTCKVYVLGFEEGESSMLTGQTVNPGIAGASENAEFYSSDESVVDIVDGQLVGLKDGEATIVCADKGIEVSKTVQVAGILSEKPYLFEGNSMQMSTNDDISGTASGWTSADTTVATVDDKGVVTAVKAGSTEISCRTQDNKVLKTTVNIVGMKDPDLFLQSGENYASPLISGEGFDAVGIEWKSEDKNVLRVDESGNIKAVNGGETKISCSIDGQELAGEVHVMSMPDEAFTAVGMDSQLKVDYAGDNPVTWKSSDESKVKVDNGVLEGVGTGTATITATAKDRTFSCEVDVVQLSASSLKMKDEGKETLEISGVDLETQEVKWSSADETIATVSEEGEVTPVSAGSTTVYCNIGPSTMSIPVTVEESDLEKEESQPADEGQTESAEEVSETEVTEEPSETTEKKDDGKSEEKEDEDKKTSKPSSQDKETTEETVEKVPNKNGQLTGAEAMIACGNYYNSKLEDAVKKGEKWVYSNSSKYVAQSGTFEKMLAGKIRGGNCASIANWAFRDMGIISSSQKFYGDGNGKIRNYNSGSKSLKSTLDKSCTIISGGQKSFGSLVSSGKVKVGDVIIGKGHTFVYRGNGTVFASGHDAKWHKDRSVKTEDSNKAVFESWVRKYKGTYDERFKVHYIIRIKDSFVPKYYRDEDGNLVKNR